MELTIRGARSNFEGEGECQQGRARLQGAGGGGWADGKVRDECLWGFRKYMLPPGRCCCAWTTVAHRSRQHAQRT
jgi:hypothetical protein